MKKLQILRITAATVLGVGFSAGVASAATTGSISGPTGPDSNNQVTFNGHDRRTVENRNNVTVKSWNPQDARSGEAEVEGNTTGGSAHSGDATNDSLTRANMSLNNAGSGAAAMNSGSHGHTGTITGATGPGSNNQVTFNGSTEVSVQNHNNVSVHSYNHQDADSGEASVENNTTGGNAMSGAATNISTTEVTLSITN